MPNPFRVSLREPGFPHFPCAARVGSAWGYRAQPLRQALKAGVATSPRTGFGATPSQHKPTLWPEWEVWRMQVNMIVIATRGVPTVRLVPVNPPEQPRLDVLAWLRTHAVPHHARRGVEQIDAGIQQERNAWD